jgi:hypothetical protein
MLEKKAVSIFVDSDVSIWITSNKEEADYYITSTGNNTVKTEDKNISIRKYLLNNKISLNAGGFNYLLMAIDIVCKKIESDKKYSLSKDVYPVISKRFSVTTLSVERAIWNAIKRSDAEGIGAKRFIEKYKLGM